MNIKICGVRTIDIAQEVVNSGASHIGFVFFPRSPRNISPAKAAEIASYIRGSIKIVAVTVDASDELLSEINSVLKPDYIQLHGAETPARASDVKRRYNTGVIKAISVRNAKDIEQANQFKKIADHIMFDAKADGQNSMPGGNAVSFDWSLLKGFIPDYKWILSGGLNHRNVKEAIEITGANFVDVSSGVESIPGSKDVSLIRAFIRTCQH